MKRFQFLTGFLCGALLFAGFTSVASAASGIMAAISNQAVYVDGQRVYMTAYQIGGNNYVKLRDIGEAALEAGGTVWGAHAAAADRCA